ncbi:MAG: tetratricopeptide repeat protein [Candidatus Competibacteraceae bacterium]|nr:tetratricopeptide repeat protein [Candidatus Competibacteraceae bacterium]MCP5125046.1 tetratricopeptide repeat protein [Gammaproteobacteria bacterium]
MNTKVSKQDQWFLLAYQAHQTGNLDEAERQYRRILRKQPTDAETLFLLGTLCLQQERYMEAIKLFSQARKLRPRHAETLNNLGLAFYKIKNFIAAQDCFEKAIVEKSDYAAAYSNLSLIFEEHGSIEEAIAGYTRAIELNPSYVDAYNNLGLLLKQQDRFTEAEIAFCHAVELAPGEARIWNDLCTVYKMLGQLTQAEHCAREALARDPEHFKAWNNLGAILQERGAFAEALAAYQRAESLNPEDPMPAWNQAYALLSAGRLAEGWVQYETRWKVYGDVALPCPAWDGEILTDGTLLVLDEQGLGDEIMFASCIPDTLDRASRVIVRCELRLAPLYVRSFPQVWVAGMSRTSPLKMSGLPQPDRAICIGSLPRVFRPSLDSFPKTVAYLRADPQRIEYWRERLATFGQGLNVGICWRSGLGTGERYKHYTTLADWVPLFSIPGAQFINLQYDDCAAELAEARDRLGVDIVNFTDIDLRNDQDEVAALMSALDLVISAGTAVAALAGALGRPVWVFLYTIGWTSLGTDCFPWMPSVRLFPKTLPDDPWTSVFEQMAEELRKWAVNIPHQPLLLTETVTVPMTSIMAANYVALALDARTAGRLDKAQQYCQIVLDQCPEQADAWHLLGVVLRERGEWEGALTALNRAHVANPQEPTILVNRGRVLQDLGRVESALAAFRTALELDEDCLEARLSLGELLDTQEQWDEALAVLQPALTLGPHDPQLTAEVQYLVAQTLHHQCRLAEAVRLLREAITLRPDYFEAIHKLANCLEEQGQLVEALTYYHAAIALRPDNPKPRQNAVFVELALGNLDAGWADYELRLANYQLGGSQTCQSPFPTWQGEDLTGRAILVYAEQGIGDQILFTSCIPDLLARARRVMIVIDPRLGPIYARSFPHATIYPTYAPNSCDWTGQVTDCDYQIAVGSLPRWLRTRIEDFPNRPAFLQADPARVTEWRARLDTLGNNILKVGICWRSGLRSGTRNRYYTPIETWGPILTQPGVTFVNLQYDECAEELAQIQTQFGVEVVNFADLDLRNDQDGVAALMSALDLVISAPTAVAALAAALGRPVWYYGRSWPSLGTNYMPWFPTLRIFPKLDVEAPWDGVIEAIAAALQERLAKSASTTLIESFARSVSAVSQPLLTQKTQQEKPKSERKPTGKTGNPSDLMAQALAARESGKLQAAEQLCRQVLARHPNHADSWHLLGVVLREHGAQEEALAALERAHAAHPQEPTILVNRGRVLQDLQQVEPAMAAFRAALELDAGCLEARLSLGELLDAQDRWDDALAILQPALALASDHAEFAAQVHYAIAHALFAQRQLREAEQHLREAVRLDPAYSGAHNGLGNLLRDQSRLEEALVCYQTAVMLRPNQPEFHSNLGNVLRELGQLSAAETAYREALRLQPDYADAWSNLGNLLVDCARPQEAIEAYRRAIELAPDDAIVRWNIAPALLYAGKLTEGWEAYEWRWPSGTQGQLLQWYPEWKGEDLTRCKILLLPEQGLGDEIMFGSCIPDVLARAGQVVLVCQERLGALYARSFPAAQVVAQPAGLVRLPADLPICDFQIAIGSLPRLLRTRIEDFPNRLAYLRADPAQVEFWRARLAELGQGLKVGICWRSGLQTGGRHRFYTALTDWKPILKIPGVAFINLQYDDCAEELAEVQMRFGVEIISFADLDLRNDQDRIAALITALDGVMSAGTAVASLAGALGVPTLLYGIGWTSLGTCYNPWFPTIRLFPRNNPEGPWEEVTIAMAAALSEWVAQADAKSNTIDAPRQLVDTRHGPMLIASTSAAARDLLRSGEYAPTALTLLTSLLRPGDWVVEAGADIGAFTLALARAVGTEGLVVACEPQRDAFGLLCANLALNGTRQAHAECLALDGTLPVETGGAGVAWLRARRPHAESIDALALPRCDLIRMGIGANVLAVLAGARATLNRFKPFVHIEGCANLPAVSEQLSASGYAWQLQNQGSTVVDVLAYPKLTLQA